MAAVVAVDPDPSAAFLIALFLSLFFWEIGGQNIPNDLTAWKRIAACRPGPPGALRGRTGGHHRRGGAGGRRGAQRDRLPA